MRYLVITIFMVMCGCTTATPMKELQAQALQTGDWSLVEKRERQIARRNARRGNHCPKGSVGVCVSRMGELTCHCVDRSSVNTRISGRPW